MSLFKRQIIHFFLILMMNDCAFSEVATVDLKSVSREKNKSESAHFNLNEFEQMEYKTLMEGENRFWYPQLDPLEVLGINAKNEEERAHYAERYVKKTQERIQKELKFIEMVERKWKELLSFKKDKE